MISSIQHRASRIKNQESGIKKMFGNEKQHHKRSVSSVSNGHKKSDRTFSQVVPPIPPPRSAPSTCRRLRRNIGDTIFITSSSSVYVNHKNDDILVIVGEPKSDVVRETIYVNNRNKNKSDLPKFKLILVEEGCGTELQEINCFIGTYTFPVSSQIY